MSEKLSGDITREELKTILNNYFTEVSDLPEDETALKELELTSKDGKYSIKIGEILTGSLGNDSGGGGTLPTATGTKPYLPSSDFSKVAGTDLITGLVIEDSQKNQYVWIEVPQTATVYPTAGLAITNFTDEEYTKIENDLHTYTNTYRNETSATDTNYEDTDNDGWYADEIKYNTAKQKMLKSVYQNGGFWIGRYEAGIETNRTASGIATTIPQSKANLYPYTYVTRTQAKVLAEKVNSGSYTSSLMFGVQWDLALKYLETKGSTIDELNTNSSNWGNCYKNTYNITSTNAKYSLDHYETWNNAPYHKTAEDDVLLTTGANSTFSKQNIYDLAGNVWEWTNEYTSLTYSCCSLRGGYYGAMENPHVGLIDTPASFRYGGSTDFSSLDSGFRVSIY